MSMQQLPRLASSVGRRLCGVSLYLLDEEFSSVEMDDRAVAVEADMGICLHFDDGGQVVVRWDTPGAAEGLIEEDLEAAPDDVVVCSVSDLVLGASGGVIAAVDVVEARFDWSARVAPWAVAISLENGSRFSIALGEIVDSKIVYSADSLVLILAEFIGRGYSLDGADDPAWGHPV